VINLDKGLQRWFLLRIAESKMLEPPAEENGNTRNAAEKAAWKEGIEEDEGEFE